jgi:hypothetical protein
MLRCPVRMNAAAAAPKNGKRSLTCYSQHSVMADQGSATQGA